MRHLSWAVPRAFIGNADDQSCRLRLRLRASLPQGRRALSASGCARATAGRSCPCLPWAWWRESPRRFGEIMSKALTGAFRSGRCAARKRNKCNPSESPASSISFRLIRPHRFSRNSVVCLYKSSHSAVFRRSGIVYQVHQPGLGEFCILPEGLHSGPSRRLLSAGDDIARDLSCP